MTAKLLEDQARELAGMSGAWKVWLWKNQGPPGRPELMYFELTGAVAEHAYKSGPRKGRTNWNKRDMATERTVVITPAEHDAWLASWAARTGLCPICGGDGRRVQRVSVKDGTTYRVCRECGGSGRARVAGEVAEG